MDIATAWVAYLSRPTATATCRPTDAEVDLWTDQKLRRMREGVSSGSVLRASSREVPLRLEPTCPVRPASPLQNAPRPTPSEPSVGYCVNLSTDPMHCGACDIACPGIDEFFRHAFATCEYGVCKRTCDRGWVVIATATWTMIAETHTDSDPNNCGSCGNRCDAVAGQACAYGRCVVAPCQQEGVITQ